MTKKIALVLAMVFLGSACGSPPKKVAKAQYRKGEKAGKSQKYTSQDNLSADDLIYDKLEHRQGSGVHYSSYIKANKDFDIPVVSNAYVDKWIDYFTGKGRRHFERYLARSGRFVPYIHTVLKKYDMPKDIVYLSMIESGFNIRAQSWASAVGPWQFIRSTGAMYGLNVDFYIDERRDVEKSTSAAVRHLKDLHDEFGNWYLAFAAYNAGAGKVRNAIKRNGSDFWDMVRGSYLRQETKDYVPKILAAAIIAKNPEKYGFTNIRFQDYVPSEVVKMRGPTDLEVAAQCAGVDADLIRLLNPELLRDITPPQITNYGLKVPRGTADRFEKKYAELSPAQRGGAKEYIADRGDSASKIAAQFGIAVKELAESNPGKVDTRYSTKRDRVKVAVRGSRGKTRYQWKTQETQVAEFSIRPGTKLIIPKTRSGAAYDSSRDDIAAYQAGDKYGMRLASSDDGDRKKDKKKGKDKKDKKSDESSFEIAKADSPKSVKKSGVSDLAPLPTSGSAVKALRSDLETGSAETPPANVVARSDLDVGGDRVEDNSGDEPAVAMNAPTNFPSAAAAASPSEIHSPSEGDLQAAVRGLPVRENSDLERLPSSENAPEKKKEWVPLVAEAQAAEMPASRSRRDPPSLPQERVSDPAPTKTKTVAEAKELKEVKKSKYRQVKAGDTLRDIAAENGVTMEQLKAWNGKKVDPVLLSGMKILVQGGPDVSPKIEKNEKSDPVPPMVMAKNSSASEKSEKPVKGSRFYKVKSGDQLNEVASRFGVSPDDLREWNGKKVSPTLLQGATIAVQDPQPTKIVKYKVKQGDNLIKIAEKHSTTPEKIQQANRLKTQVAPLGAVLTIPR